METSATGESCPPFEGAAARVAAWLTALSLIVTMLCLIQQYSGFGWKVRHEIENERVQKTEDYFRWRLPEQYRTDLVDRTAVLLKDGTPWLNRSQNNKYLREFGAGWFYLVGGGVNFIPDAGIDPRQPGNHLSLVTPWQFKTKFWPKLAAVVFALVLLQQWLRRRAGQPRWPGERLAGKGWERATLVTALFALVMIAFSLTQRADFTDHAYVVKGLQESDAGGWYQMAVGLKEGRGLTGAFENQRPFYSMFLAGLFSLFGEGINVLRGFNGLALLLTVVAGFTIGRLLGSVMLALALAGLLLLPDMHQNYLHAALTENAGLLLATLSLLGAWQAAWTLSWRWAVAAGLLNGLAVLSSGVTLFTLPGYVLVIALFPWWRRVSWRRALQLAVVYTAAASLVVGAWIIRQKIVHDRFALSYNSAEVLAGGSDPVDGKLTARVLQKAHDEGFDLTDGDNRYDSMMQMFKNNVAADPWGYVRRVAAAMGGSLDFLPADDPAVRTILLLALLAFALRPWLRWGQWHALVIAAVLMMLWVRHEWAVNIWLLAAAVYLLLRRSRQPAELLVVWLLLMTVLAVMFLAGLSGNVASKRFWMVGDWSVFALVLGGARHFIETSAGLIQQALQCLRLPAWITGKPASVPEQVVVSETPRFHAVACSVVIGLAALCGAVVLGQTLRGPHELFPGFKHSESVSELKTLWQQAKLREPALANVPFEALKTRVVVDNGMHAAFAAGEGTQHWLPFYSLRSFPRWVATWKVADTEGRFRSTLTALGSGAPPRFPNAQPLLAAGVYSTGRNGINGEPVPIFETLLVVPLRRSEDAGGVWQPDVGDMIVLKPTPEALASAQSAR